MYDSLHVHNLYFFVFLIVFVCLCLPPCTHTCACVCCTLAPFPVRLGWFVIDAGGRSWLIAQRAGNNVIPHYLPVGRIYVCVCVCLTAPYVCVWKCMQIDRDVLLQKRRCGKCHVTQVDWCQNSSMLSVWAFIIYEREPLLWCWQVWHTWSKRALLCVHLLFTTQGIRAIKPTTLTGGWSDSKYFFYNICIHI